MVSIDFEVNRCLKSPAFETTRKHVYRDMFSDDAADTPYLLACAANDFIDAIVKCWEQYDNEEKVDEFLSIIKEHCAHRGRIL